MEETVGSTSSAAKCGGDGVGIITSGGGGDNDGGGSDPDQRPSKKPTVSSDLEERRLARPARSKNKVTSKATTPGTVSGTRPSTGNCGCTWWKMLTQRRMTSPFSRSGGVEASPVHGRRQAQSKQVCRI